MERIWLRQYPPGVAPDINPDEFASLAAMIDDSMSRYAELQAYVQMDFRMTYREVDASSAAFAAWLQSKGMNKGDRISIMLPNLLQYPIVMFGALRAGLVVVNTNPLYTADELRHQLNDSGATAVVVLENFCTVVQAVLHDTRLKHVIVTSVGDLLPFPKGTLVDFVLRHVQRKVPAWQMPGAHRLGRVLKEFAGRRYAPVPLDHDDLAFLQYTGGTTGVAKGAMLTHGNLVANALQAREWYSQVNILNATYIVALPLYHIFSLTANALLHMLVGGFGVLIANPRDFAGFVKVLQKYPPNTMTGVNTLFNALMDTPGFERIDFSRMVACVGGGMAVQAVVADRWRKLTGCTLSQGWGLTETSPLATVNRLVDTEFNGSIGLPVSSTQISIRDESGADVGINATGELCVHGPQVMRGYWQRPEETANVMLPGGWLRTGDIGRMDDRGFVYLEDRKKDMITVSGFKVYPNEVEAVAAQIPGVFESAAVAQKDERSGEVVALYVVRRDPALTAEQIVAHLRQHLTSYKVPRNVYFRESLPKTNVGKILRRALRADG
ncbi:MAG: AMP-binding protein [Pseudomonadota bacterium]